MNLLEKYTELKKKEERAKETINKAEGALEQVMTQIKEEFDCDTLQSAEKKLKKEQAQEASIRKEFEEAINGFEKDWPDVCG